MNRETPSGTGKHRENLLCGAASVLFPTAIFSYFCAQNINEFVAIWLIYFMLGALIFLAAFAYCAALLILKRGFLALAFCMVCWIGCYLEPAITGMAINLNGGEAIPHIRLYIVLPFLALAVFSAFILRRLKRDMRKPVVLFSIVSVLILAFNLLPIVKAGFSEIDAQTDEVVYQTDFFIDSAKTDMPNVYWIHPDGMTSVDTVEKYFHEEQSEFLSALATRDFLVNPSAHFEGGATTVLCIPVLTSPYAYDTLISNYTVTHEAAQRAMRDHAFRMKVEDVRYHNEMIAAFDKKGYASSVISGFSGLYYVPLSGGAFYDFGNKKDEVIFCSEESIEKIVQGGNISVNVNQISRFLSWTFEKLYQMTLKLATDTILSEASQPFATKMPEERLKQIVPNNFTKHGVDDRKMVRSLYDILYSETQRQKIAIIHDNTPHYPFIIEEDGTLSDRDESRDPLYYYSQHAYSAKILIGMIDMILEADPDAVIVIQADHGLHGNTEEDFKTAFGEDANALELWNGTMSAIRVPEKYQTGEEHYAMENPLNMSRYLVNSFVGKNYEYLPPN